MFILMIVLIMLVLPVTSIVLQRIFGRRATVISLVGKWFVFWGVGIRLLLAGLRQSTNPRFTAKEILGIDDGESLQVVQELGFANLSIGALGISSIFNPDWITPGAIAGALFYGLAGIGHVVKKDRNSLENSAMVSDLFLSIVLVTYLSSAVFCGRKPGDDRLAQGPDS
jgi:ABC-type methionine transport system permease subunit